MLSLIACTKEENPFEEKKEEQISEKEVLISNMLCDSSNTGRYTLFNLETGKVIPNSDSATDKWDIGFQSTTIIFNSGVSGPGNTGAQLAKLIYDDVLLAPTTGYKQDAEGARVITTGSGNGWYNYNEDLHIITPIPGRVILLKTSEGNYTKMKILSYYKDAPAQPTYEMPARYYTFKYFCQTDGSTNLN